MQHRLIVIAGLVVALLAIGITIYKKFPALLHNPSKDQGTISAQETLSSVPPFGTKEPERYQAIRTTTFTETTSGQNSVNEARTTTVQIVRDGEQRREEHDGGGVGSVVFLEVVSGRFLLLPQAKLFADLGEQTSNDDDQKETELAADEVSPDLMLHESAVTSHYEKLGAETVVGRATTKYRVTPAEPSTPVASETFIWIDEALGMPIKSVTTSKNSDRTTTVSMELQDIRTEVDVKVFSLPEDYRKVAAPLIFGMIRQAANQAKLPVEQK